MFIVMYDDEASVIAPYGWDAEAEGVLCVVGTRQPAAVFETHADARRAIAISEAYHRLKKLRGENYSEEFSGAARKCIRIVKLQPQKVKN